MYCQMNVIVCVTAHVENKTMVITDALEMKRSASIDEGC